MQVSNDDYLDQILGGRPIRENMQKAVQAGLLIATPDGKWILPKSDSPIVGDYLMGGPGLGKACHTLIRGLFFGAYAQKAVPNACKNCYKVRVTPRSVRELLAVYRIAQGLNITNKCGANFRDLHSQGVYAAFFYLDGLAAARRFYKELRSTVNADPALGQDVPMRIKRGCTEYEVSCGPSTNYPIAPEDIEKPILERIVSEGKSSRVRHVGMVMLQWARVAHKLGDETYKDITRGKPIFPPTVSYDPDGTDEPPE